MRTVILSDLYLGAEGVHAGGPILGELLRGLSGQGCRVIFSGNTFDFSTTSDPPELVAAVAVRQARALVAAPEAVAALRGLGELLAQGGEAVMRLGYADLELFFPEVQAIVREALGQAPAIARRLSFEYSDAPEPIQAGGTHVIVTHGEQMDRMSRVDYFRLPGPDGSPPLKGGVFERPLGSQIAKRILGPLRQLFKMGFVDLLRPQFRAAVLAALAVDPAALKLVAQSGSVRFASQLLTGGNDTALAFADEDEGALDVGIAEAAEDAGLVGEEKDALRSYLAEGAAADTGGPMSFGDDDSGWLMRTAARKLGTAALKELARLQHAGGGATPSLDPEPTELAEAERLAKKFQASAVILGHTGFARWKAAPGLLYANTGSWAYQLRPPPPDAGGAAWEAFFKILRDDLTGALARTSRLTCATVEPFPGEGSLGGALVRLAEVTAAGALTTIAETHLPPTPLR